MSLLDTLNAYNTGGLQVTTRQPELMIKTSHRLASLASDLEEKSLRTAIDLPSLDEIVGHLNHADPLSPRQLKLACRALRQITEKPNGSNLIDAILKQTDTAPKKYMGRLYQGYLHFYAPNNDDVSKVKKHLIRHSQCLSSKIQQEVSQFDFFGSKPATQFASRIIDKGEVFETLIKRRLNKQDHGLAKSIFAAVCQKISHDGLSENTYQRFKNYVLIKKEIGQSEIIYKHEHIAIKHYCNALLSPWLSDNPPSEEIQHDVEHFLLAHFGDPRVNYQAWEPVDEAIKNTLIRWLTKQSLSLLINVLTKSNDTGHWKDRQPFWQGYFDMDAIDEAWVVFGRAAANVAQNMIKRGDMSQGGYGVLSGGERNHSVLLMRIGDIMISEWTHSGAIRIFGRNAQMRPTMYASFYPATATRSKPHIRVDKNLCSDGYFAHHQNWHNEVAKAIRDKTGIIHPDFR